MKILVIDDVRVMDFECEYARNSQEGAYKLAFNGPWDEVWFDHDLGGDDTTRSIVIGLESAAMMNMKIPKIGKCIVHTSNSSARNWLVDGLKNAGYEVFITNPPVVGHIDG